MMSTFFKNYFLVAMPSLIDSFFYQSVVYLCEHDEEGAMGIIVNRPTRIKLTELLQHLHIENQSDWVQSRTVLFGGPIKKDQGMVLHDGGLNWKSTLEIDGDLFLTLGYAGWGEGQLEQELAENSWLTVPADHALLFDTPAEQRWQASAKLLGIDIHLMANTAGHA